MGSACIAARHSGNVKMYLISFAAASGSAWMIRKIEIQKGYYEGVKMDLIKLILFLVSMTFVVIGLLIGFFIGSGILKLDAVIIFVILGFLLYMALNYYCNKFREQIDNS